MKKRLLVLSIIVTVMWMVVIFGFSNAPSDESNNGSKQIIHFIVEKFIDDEKDAERMVIKINKPFRKCAHGSVYLILSMFVNSIFLGLKRYRLYICNIISILFCFLYALSDEYHQTFVFGRTGQFTDVLIDTCGAIIGCILFNYVYNKIKNKKYVNS